MSSLSKVKGSNNLSSLTLSSEMQEHEQKPSLRAVVALSAQNLSALSVYSLVRRADPQCFKGYIALFHIVSLVIIQSYIYVSSDLRYKDNNTTRKGVKDNTGNNYKFDKYKPANG